MNVILQKSWIYKIALFTLALLVSMALACSINLNAQAAEGVSAQVNIAIKDSGSKGGAGATLSKASYPEGEEVVVKWTGAVAGDDFCIPTEIKYGNVTVKVDSLIECADVQAENSEYNRKMQNSSKATMTTWDKLQDYVTTERGVRLGTVSSLFSEVSITWQRVSPVYRLYNSITSEHLFTTNKDEYDSWVIKCQNDEDYWIGEGINWLAPSTGTSVSRLYNPDLGSMGSTSHYYTSNTEEIAELTSKHGWEQENETLGFMSSGDVAIWTCYNEGLGSAHHYTSNKSEWEGLENHGWDLERSKNGDTGVFLGILALTDPLTLRVEHFYTVNHYLENEKSTSFDLVSTTVMKGNAGEKSTAKANAYTGFVAGAVVNKSIDSSNTTVVNINYSRQILKVNFETNGGSVVATQDVKYGLKLIQPSNPVKEGHEFKGWYFDSACTESPVDFGTATMGDKDVTLYAKWEKVEVVPVIKQIDFDTQISVDLTACTYDTTQHKPAVTSAELVKETDYEVTYGENINAGKGTVTVKGIGDYTGERSYEFTINKADIPASEVAVEETLQAQAGQTLGDIKLPAKSNGTLAWQSPETSVGNVAGTFTFKADYTPNDSANYNSIKGIDVKVQVTVPVVKDDVTVSFDNQNHGSAEIPSQTVSVGSTLEDNTSLVGSEVGLEFDGWYKEQECKTKWNLTDTVNETMTLYANWIPTATGDLTKYWLAPASHITTGNSDTTARITNANYVKEEWNVKKSAAEIKADVAILRDTNSADYQMTADEYKSFMTTDSIHLYTKIGDGTTADDYAEFRIIEVGSHDSDESVLTFEAVHTFPTAVYMNQSKSNSTGWYYSLLHSQLNNGGGSVYELFTEGFRSAVAKVTKKTSAGSASYSITTTEDTFWALSFTEYTGGSQSGIIVLEGAQYEFYKGKGLNIYDNNPALVRYMRSGAIAGSSTFSDHSVWWLRSPVVNCTSDWVYFTRNGKAGSYAANVAFGVVPAFCF